jgi:hypothetical protein
MVGLPVPRQPQFCPQADTEAASSTAVRWDNEPYQFVIVEF